MKPVEIFRKSVPFTLRLCEDLAKKFEDEYDLSPDQIKENVYRKENPNTYLAKFAQFIIKNKEVVEMKSIIEDGLQKFISHQILQFENAKDVPILYRFYSPLS